MFSFFLLSVVLSASIFTTLASSSASALTINGGSDCSANSVINCGATTSQQVINDYNNTSNYPGVHAIYSYFGITATDIASLNNTAVVGHVDKDGNVYVGGVNGTTLVATAAITAGRDDISPGSTKVTYQGLTFYTRRPAISFLTSSIAAFVVMKAGVFQYAILAPCGNPVKATIVPQPTYSCTALTLSIASSDPNTVAMSVTHAQANGATFKNVTYVISNTTAGTTTSVSGGDSNVSYTFSKPGVQKIVATVNFTVSGSVVMASSAGCSKSITIAPPSTPNYSCSTITVSNDPTNPDSIIVTSTYSPTTPTNGVSFNSVTYDFGDDPANDITVTNPINLTVNYTYANPGTYLVSATYTFNVGTGTETVSSANCEKNVTFLPPPSTMCTLPGLTQYPANSPNCVTVTPPPPTPGSPTPGSTTALVNTGPGGIALFAIILGSAAIVSGTGYYLTVRYKNKKLL